MENTSNYGLKRWDGGDRILHTEFNDNWDKIDTALKSSAEAQDSKADRRLRLSGAQLTVLTRQFAALLEAGRLALEVEQKNHLLAVQAPKVAFADRVAGDEKGVNIGNYARAVGLGQNVLFRALRDNHILMSGGNRHNLPFQDYIERGYFTVKEGTRTHNDETVPTFTPMVTGKGQQWLTRRLIDLGYLKPIAA